VVVAPSIQVVRAYHAAAVPGVLGCFTARVAAAAVPLM
jgi:hypothetical protein